MDRGMTRVRRIGGRVAALVTSAVVSMAAVGVTLATDLHEGQPPVTWDDPRFPSECVGDPPGTAEVIWHFVLTQPQSETATLTAEFVDAGAVQVANTESGSPTLHFDVTTGRDTLVGASTDVEGNALLLSSICLGEDPVFGGETPAGSNVSIYPAYAGGMSPIQLTFESVDVAGNSTLTATQTAPALPAGFQLGDPPTYYDLQTTATYSGQITVCLSYAAQTPAPTALLHYEGGQWVDVTVSNDTFNQVICAITTSLSPFAAVHPIPPSIVGFFQPLNDPVSDSNPMSVFKRGSTIPVKFALRDYAGALLSDTDAAAIAAACRASISLTQTAGSAPVVDEAVNSATPNSGTCFRYDAAADQFIFNLGTKVLAAPSTYVITATLVGPDAAVLASHSLSVGLR